MKKNAEHVPQDRREGDQQPQPIIARVDRIEPNHPAGGERGNQSLEQIQNEDDPEESFAQQPPDVGGADVAAAGAADIDALGPAHKKTKGNRTGEISQRREGEEYQGRGHGGEMFYRRSGGFTTGCG